MPTGYGYAGKPMLRTTNRVCTLASHASSVLSLTPAAVYFLCVRVVNAEVFRGNLQMVFGSKITHVMM